MKQAVLKITGRVQGVFYRSNAQEEAEALGLTGYAKNMPDGSVEALVQGEESAVNAFIEWCREGSSSASVSQVQVEWQESEKRLKNFEIRY